MKLQPNNIDYIKDLLLKNNELQVLSANVLREIPNNDLLLFCVERGLYSLPTKELIEFVVNEINGESAIEIGSGHGALAREVGIIATDSYLQNNTSIKAIYDVLKQPTVHYGCNVLQYNSDDAIRKFRPSVVVGAYVTHKYHPKYHYNEGNIYGVNEHTILEKCNKYIFIGNKNTHSKKLIKSQKPYYKEYKFDWLFGRTMAQEENCIWIWEQ